MGRKKKELPTTIERPRVIIYDDKEIQYISGILGSVDYEPHAMPIEYIDGSRSYVPLHTEITIAMDNPEFLNNIELDDTLMKRIAVFNKSRECQRLDKEIEDRKNKLKEIEEVLSDRTVRLKKLKEFIADIYDMDIKDDDDYDWDD